MRTRRKMQLFDWMNAAALLVIGVLLGVALDSLMVLVAAGAWLMAILIPIPFLAIFVADWLLDWLGNLIFPSGIKPADRSRAKGRKPLVLLLSIPTGIVLGLIGAQFGLGALFL